MRDVLVYRCPGATEQVSMGDATGFQCIKQGTGDMFLPYYIM